MDYTPESLVKEFTTLVSMPAVALQVNTMVDDPKCSATDIGKLISQDPALTARLLKIANSPFYGLSAKIDTVSRAITILGTRQIRDLVLATSTIDAFEGIPNELVTMEKFWFHNVACGIISRQLMSECRPEQGETIFIAGLLHDIGQLIIFNKLPELTKEVFILCMEGPDDLELYQAEQKLMGFDHAQVGCELLKQWNLPPSLLECVRYHHDVAGAKEFPFEVSIVHIANSLAVLTELDSNNLDDAPAINPLAWEISGLSSDIIWSTIELAKPQIAEVQSLLTSN